MVKETSCEVKLLQYTTSGGNTWNLIKRLIKYASIYFYTSKGRATVNSKKLLYVMCFTFILLLFGISGTVWAQWATYNRPNPLMDYTPQELGTYDTGYTNYDEAGCRPCHGYSTTDRHHGVPMVVNDHLCNPCHLSCTEGAPDCVNGITIHRHRLRSHARTATGSRMS